MLGAGRAPAHRDWNERARADREALLGAGLVGGPVHELRVSVPNRPGVIAEIALALGAAGSTSSTWRSRPPPTTARA